MVAHLRERADALVRVGWTRRKAEWLALVCLHSGVFLRSQHLAFIGWTNPALAHRFVRQCRQYAVEQPWNGSLLRVCRIAARRMYRVLGVEYARHLRPAAPEVVLRRRLAPREDLEREMMRDALGRDGSVARAASEMGVTRQGLSNLTARLQIHRFHPTRERSSHAPSR